MNIPQGNSKEDLKQREEIIDQVYRRWTEETVKMMVGVKRSGEKVQYCITAILA